MRFIIKNIVKIICFTTAFSIFSFPLLNAQTDNIPFTPRVLKSGDPTSGTGIYKIRGDFNIIGNSNLNVAPFWSATAESLDNTYPMTYIDIDDDITTVNSSKATLNFSNENNADHNCTNIIFAGLYWGGLGDISAKGATGPDTWNIAPKKYLRHGDTYNGWTLSITITNVSNNSLTANTTNYTFSKPGYENVTLTIRRSNVVPELVQGERSQLITSGITCRPIPDTSPTHVVSVIELEEPIYIGSGSGGLVVKQITFTGGTSSISSTDYCNMSLIAVTAGSEVTLSKKKIKFKHSSKSDYIEINADTKNEVAEIFHKTGVASRSNIYCSYADVTQYVKENGLGEYTVANLAATDGCSAYMYNFGSSVFLGGNQTGKSAGWGLLVIYENNKMNWRNISAFDGYSYIEASGGSTVTNEYLIDISGINTIQNGPVNIKLAGIAFEGDRSLGGDYVQVKKVNGDWLNLSYSGNSTDNFFNSSIYTGGNPRNPQFINNFGTDIYIFDIPNSDNSVVSNNQTTLNFKIGSTADDVIINSFAFAVDAYVPEIDPYNRINKIAGVPVSSQDGLTVKPGEEIEYILELRNVGNEPFTDAYVDIPIPYNAHIVSYDASYYQNITGSVAFDNANNILRWEFTSDLPVITDNPVLATLTYTIKATEDCFILEGHCLNGITIQGYLSGKGAISGEVFDRVELVHKYDIIDDCFFVSNTDPTLVNIDKEGFDCSSITAFRTFIYPEDMGAINGIPISEIKTYFPSDVKFYNRIDENTGDPSPYATEYTVDNPFPKIIGKYYYYGIYTVLGVKCWQKFSIHVFGIDGNVCVGDELSEIFKNTDPDEKDEIEFERFDYFIYDQNNEASTNKKVSYDYLFQPDDNGKYLKYVKCDGCDETEIDIESSFILLNVKPLPTITDNKGVLYVGELFHFTGNPTGGEWTSSDPLVVEITIDGAAIARKKGEAILTYESNGCAVSLAVTVMNENKWIGGNRGLNPQPGGLTDIENNYWSITSNWTDGRLPIAEERVIFHADAIDLYVNSSGNVEDDIYIVKGIDNSTQADLIIPANCGLNLTENTETSPAINFTNSANVIIHSENPDNSASTNGTFIVPENTKVNAIVNFYTKAKGPEDATDVADMSWQYFGIPVKKFRAGDLYGTFIRRYDETKTITEDTEEGSLIYYWHWLHNESMMIPVAGYEISRRDTYSGYYSFHGELNTSNMDTVLSITPNTYFKGQHVVSNPYTAALNIKTGLQLGVENDDTFSKTLYLFHTGTPEQWNSHIGINDGTLPGQYLAIPQENAGEGNLPLFISSMQGFVVQLDPNIIATESNKDARTLKFKYNGVGNSNFPMRTNSSKNDKIHTMISLSSNEKLKDRTWLFINDNSTRAFDNGYDGKKIIASSSLAQLFACEEDGIYQVNTVPDIHNTYFGFKAEKNIRNYTLTFNHCNVERKYKRLFLIDLETSTTTEITADRSTYSFTAYNETAAQKRFIITASTKETNDIQADVNIFQTNGNIIFINQYDKEVPINIYNAVGNLIFSLKLSPLSSTTISEREFNTGIYIIKIYGDNVPDSSHKIIIQ